MSGSHTTSLRELPSTHLLCEKCGYDIHEQVSTLSDVELHNGLCPECGHILARSVPKLKPGSLLERKREWHSSVIPIRDQLWLCANWFRLAKANMRSMDCVASKRVRISLIKATVLVTAFSAMTWATGFFLLDPLFWSQSTTSLSILFVVAVVFLCFFLGCVTLALFTLIMFTNHGMQFLAQTRGWRLTLGNSKAIVAHAMPGWLMGAHAGLITAILTGVTYQLTCTLDQSGFLHTGSLGLKDILGAIHFLAAPFIATFGGFVAFEWFCLVGMRERKFCADPVA